MYLQLIRTKDNGKQTKGFLQLKDSQAEIIFHCQTLELSYKNNTRKISCIKSGTYQVIPNLSFKHGRSLRLLNVIGRDNVLIHSGNFNNQTHGCILIGNGWSDINKDGQLDLLNSKITMDTLLAILKSATTIKIIDETI